MKKRSVVYRGFTAALLLWLLPGVGWGHDLKPRANRPLARKSSPVQPVQPGRSSSPIVTPSSSEGSLQPDVEMLHVVQPDKPAEDLHQDILEVQSLFFSTVSSGIQIAEGLRRRQDAGPTTPTQPAPAAKDIQDFIPTEDRWRIGYKRNLLDPYNQNVLKGDYPIIGQNIFFILTAITDSLFEFRELPIPSGPTSQQPNRAPFFGDNDQYLVRQNFLLRFEFYEGDTAFKPADWLVSVQPVFNINDISLAERGGVNPDVRDGTDRLRGDVALQEAFLEYHLTNLTRRYDFISVKAGIQPFNSDFRSFIFNDSNLGLRFFGNFGNNRFQYNLAYFEMLEKETNSGLNTFESRDQRILITNVYWQDPIGLLGYTMQFSLHYNRDEASFLFDVNDFLVRPDPVGIFTPHDIDVVYLGWTGEGHIGRVNINHAFYQAIGRDKQSPLAGREVDINAQMVALEITVDSDWLRPKLSFFWASGDGDPTDGDARGFDSILDKPNFAGGGFSFWNRQGIKLLGVNLVQGESLVPDLRSSKTQGQVNFVNPGLLLFNAGLDVEVTPKLKTSLNLNYLQFHKTEPLEHFLLQPDIEKEIGYDLSLGFTYRPLLNNNIVVMGGLATFFPGGGFKDLLTNDTLFQGFINLILTY